MINILGTGCPNCLKLETNTKEATRALELNATINKITDIEKIMAYEIMSLPALVVDNKIVCAGRVPSLEEIKDLLSKQIKKDLLTLSSHKLI